MNLEEEVSDTGDLDSKKLPAVEFSEFYLSTISILRFRLIEKSRELRRKLKQIIMNHIRQYSGKVNIAWTQVEFPDISSSLSDEAKMKEEIEAKIQICSIE